MYHVPDKTFPVEGVFDVISGIGGSAGAYPVPLGGGVQPSASKDGRSGELTTVTTHCDKDHWHTPACPHTVYTRPVEETQRRGEYIDLYV